MPRSFPHFVDCAPPGLAREFTTTGNIIVTLLYSFFLGTITALIIAGTLSQVIAGVITAGCIIGPIVIASLFFGVDWFRIWYGSRRLMCVDEKRCIVGTMADDPAVSSFDGDRKIDVLLAPFIYRDAVGADPTDLASHNVKDYFIAEIQGNTGLFGPGPVDITETSQLISYIDGLADSTRIELYMRVVHKRMFDSSVPERHYQRHFHVRDVDEMGTAAFNEAPPDEFGIADPNPLFKMNYRPPPAPFLHCELEGNKWEKILTNLQVALAAAFLAFLGVCAVCLGFGLPEPACSLIGGAIALLLAWLAWWIMDQVNDPDDGAADQSDIDFEDPAFDGDQMTIVPGDGMLVYGDWIMDMEHEKYFELHPIRAIYLVCNTGNTSLPWWELVDDLSGGFPRRDRCPFPMEQVTAEDMEQMCRLVANDEEEQPVVLREVTNTVALSMYAGFR